MLYKKLFALKIKKLERGSPEAEVDHKFDRETPIHGRHTADIQEVQHQQVDEVSAETQIEHPRADHVHHRRPVGNGLEAGGVGVEEEGEEEVLEGPGAVHG